MEREILWNQDGFTFWYAEQRICLELTSSESLGFLLRFEGEYFRCDTATKEGVVLRDVTFYFPGELGERCVFEESVRDGYSGPETQWVCYVRPACEEAFPAGLAFYIPQEFFNAVWEWMLARHRADNTTTEGSIE
jgi:hypothetical protein